MAATKQKICTLYVCQLITTLQRRFWKDKEGCINLAVIQASKTNLQGMALSSYCSFLRKLTLDIWVQFRKCLIFFSPSMLDIRDFFLHSIQYLTFKRHHEFFRRFMVIFDKQKNKNIKKTLRHYTQFFFYRRNTLRSVQRIFFY